MAERLPRKGTLERVKLDAFMGGVCCALSAAFYGEDAGTDTYYIEVVESVGADDLLAYALRERDIELPRIRAAIRRMRDNDLRLAANRPRSSGAARVGGVDDQDGRARTSLALDERVSAAPLDSVALSDHEGKR